jgi:hypothetical protein
LKNMTSTTILSLCAAALLTLGTAAAQHSEGTKTTFLGRVVGLACYMGHGTIGDSHRECALTCAKAGIPMGIVDQETGTLYLPLAKDHHQAANADLMAFVEKEVRVSGSVIEKDGMKAIVLESLATP